MNLSRKYIIPFCLFVFLACTAEDCQGPGNPQSASGVRTADVAVQPGSDGFTTEQRNVRERVIEDNKPGSIKHLYVISPYSGQVILYSTVKGKVTSSTKRLHPSSVSENWSNSTHGFTIDIGSQRFTTQEVLSDDGTYGPSNDYIYWWDVRGVYHQHFMTGGQIVHISNQPIAVKSVILNLEQTKEN